MIRHLLAYACYTKTNTPGFALLVFQALLRQRHFSEFHQGMFVVLDADYVGPEY